MSESQISATHISIEILIKDGLDDRWQAWFAGLELSATEQGGARLRGRLPDHAALHGVLERIRNFNLRIISVRVVDELKGDER